MGSSTPTWRRRPPPFLVLVIVVVLVFAAVVYVDVRNAATILQPLGPSAITATCVISGQPGPFYFRVVSDSTVEPVVGARVSATNRAAYCGDTPATTISTYAFTTNSSGTYSLNTQNNAGYSLVVSYAGHGYSFNASLAPVSVTCATLYIPSGRANVTVTEMQTSCPWMATTSSG